MPSTSTKMMLLKQVRPMGAATTDILIEGDSISRIENDILLAGEAHIEQCNDAIIIPGLVDAHTHLDKTFWGLPWLSHQAGPQLVDRIENEQRMRREMKLSLQLVAFPQSGLMIQSGVAELLAEAVDSGADVLQRVMLLGYRSNFRRDEDLDVTLDIVTQGGAKVMGFDNHAILPGSHADLVLVAAVTIAETVVAFHPRKLVIRHGQIVARDGTYLVN